MYVTYDGGGIYHVRDTKLFVCHMKLCWESKTLPRRFHDPSVGDTFKVSDYPGSKALTRTEIYERE